MVSKIRVYVEGGGDHNDTKVALRKGFHQFLRPVIDEAQQRNVGFQIIMGGSRHKTLDAFTTAVNQHRDSFCVLLVDSEGPIVRGPLDRLPQYLTESCCHLMVQAMEAWFLADRDALKDYYGSGFLPGRLPDPAHIEEVPKDDLVPILEHATSQTQKGKYHKTRHAPDLLARIDPLKERQACRYCERLFRELEDALKQ